MNILVTGASGFIASQIVADLIAAGHTVTCCVRNVAYTKRIFPASSVIACDFVKDTAPETWMPRLKNMDVVVNCAGIFYHPNHKYLWDIHFNTPRALFDACIKSGVKKIIQISALGIEQCDVAYAKSKKAADDYLLKLPIKAIILRPSLVYGQGSYGGTSLFRGLAGLWATPVPGKGTQELQPIHLQDLSKAILHLIEKPLHQSKIFHAVGPKRINLKEILVKTRAWLGFPSGKLLFVPLWLIRLGAFIGNLFPYSVINSSGYQLLMQNNVANEKESNAFHEEIGFIPQDFDTGLHRHPSTVQDHWHAKLYFLKPLLQLSLAFIWLFTAFCSAFWYPKADSYALLAKFGITGVWQPIMLYGACVLDALIGLAILFHYQVRKIGWLQIGVILAYTALITWKLPDLWLHPFAPIAKNIPILVAILIFLALEDNR